MKKRIPFPIVLLMALLCTGTLIAGTFSPPTVVQTGVELASTSVSPTPNLASDPTVPHLLACDWQRVSGTAAVPSPGAQWTPQALATGSGIFTRWVQAGDTHTNLPPVITNNPVGGNNQHMVCWEVANVNGQSPVAGATINNPAATARPASLGITPGPNQQELELGYLNQTSFTPSPTPPSPSPSAVVSATPGISGGNGAFGAPASATYTGNGLPFTWTYATGAFGAQTIFNIDIQGQSSCLTFQSLIGAGC